VGSLVQNGPIPPTNLWNRIKTIEHAKAIVQRVKEERKQERSMRRAAAERRKRRQFIAASSLTSEPWRDAAAA